MPVRRRMARRTGRRAARRTMRKRAAVAPMGMRRAAPMSRGRRRRPLAALLAVGGTAAVAYKIGKNNAQKVEQHTGKSFDDLSEEELGTAMEELDIDLPEEDEASGEELYEEEPDYIEELERLAGLKEKGIISEEDFEAKKKQLLGL